MRSHSGYCCGLLPHHSSHPHHLRLTRPNLTPQLIQPRGLAHRSNNDEVLKQKLGNGYWLGTAWEF